MLASNVTLSDLETALHKINEQRFEGNVEFNRLGWKGRRIRFTLRVKDSSGPGHRIGRHSARRMVSACWHVHGHFFEELFKVAPDAVVYSGGNGQTITKDGGNWVDWNAGSILSPVPASCLCECQ